MCVRACMCACAPACLCMCVIRDPVTTAARGVFQSVQTAIVFNFNFFCVKASVPQDFSSIQHCDYKD